MTMLLKDHLITFEYKNHRGEEATRTARVIKVCWGETPYHSGEQWIFTGYDFDRQANRDFAMKDMRNVRHYNPDEDEVRENGGE